MRVSCSTPPLPSSTVLAAITMRFPCAGACDETGCASAQIPITPKMHEMIFANRMIASPFHQ